MKNSFILYTDLGPSILELKDAEAGRLYKAIYRYVLTWEITALRGAAKVCFDVIRNHLDRDQAKYEQTCLKRAEAGRKGGLSGRREANAKLCLANEADNDNRNDNNNENDIDNKNGNDNGNESENGNAYDSENVSAAFCGKGAPDPDFLRTKYPRAAMSRQDIAQLLREFPSDYEKYLKRLSDFLICNDVPCDDPLGTIRIWAVQDACRAKSRKETGKDWGRLGGVAI